MGYAVRLSGSNVAVVKATDSYLKVLDSITGLNI
jgi:hypothetical protein